MIKLLIILLTGFQVFFNSCARPNVKKKSKTSIIDSSFANILKQNLSIRYKLGEHDRSLLDIIAENDTGLINRLRKENYSDELSKRVERNLFALIDEPDLSEPLPENTQIYRMQMESWHPHSNLIIRIQNHNDSISIYSKRFIRSGGNLKLQNTNVRVDSILYSTNKTLSLSKWNKFIKRIDDAYFWELSYSSFVWSLDGRYFELEGARNLDFDDYISKYHKVERCDLRGSLKEALKYLLKLADEDSKEID